tara:strand:+ start:243 stop:872 length:630 start_codon:yes stop_codon:yes gene_type:complete
MNISDYIKHIDNSIYNSNKHISKLNNHILNIECMCDTKTKHLYNNLCNFPNCKYLEIGVYKGGTLCCSFYKNNIKCLGIDNFSQFDINNNNKQIVINNINQYKTNLDDIIFVNTNCWDINKDYLKNFNIYKYDAEHTYEYHYKSLEFFLDCMDNIFIFIVELWNIFFIRKSILDAIKNIHIKILYNKIYSGNYNNKSYEICILLLKKNI